MTDKVNPFSIVAPLPEPVIELEATQESSTLIPPEDEPDIRTPLERLIERELKTKKYILAYYDENGDTGYHVGEDMDAEAISFVTDVIKARVMMQLLLD
ncbi:MAG: hypothetical protein ACOYOV_00295 [Bacteroidales bacterium]